MSKQQAYTLMGKMKSSTLHDMQDIRSDTKDTTMSRPKQRALRANARVMSGHADMSQGGRVKCSSTATALNRANCHYSRTSFAFVKWPT